MRLASVFSDNMVLQRDCPIPVWGKANPAESISVELAGQTVSTKADSDGRWKVQLPALPAGGPHTLVARGSKILTLRDVLVGEVWVCSGQSNMQWLLEQSAQPEKAISEADSPQIRLFTVPRITATQPMENVDGAWSVCTPTSAAAFSAVGYYFGRELHRRLKVPIGLINSSWGGTPAQAWTSREELSAEPTLAGFLDEVRIFELSTEQAQEKRAADRLAFLAKLPKDAGNNGFAEGWAGADYDDSSWKSMNLPGHWSGAAGLLTNGVFWFRKTVDVTASWAGQALKLSLGSVDKSDDTYVNGQRVGGMNWVFEPESWCTPRNYVIPAGVIRPGRNVIAVRVVSSYTGGGIIGPSSLMHLHSPESLGEKPLELAGAWPYRIEQDFGRVTGITDPKVPTTHQLPTVLFNAMIAPLIPYAIRGVIWYQGESNAGDAARYHTLFPTMIRDWRQRWGQKDFYFNFVQLANYGQQPANAESDDSRWAELREAQTATLSLPQTGMAVAIDIGEEKDIHPRNKLDVGLRLAFNALAQIHKLDVPHQGPSFRSLKVNGSSLHIEFNHADGLTARGGEVSGFALAGADRIFHVATAKIDGTSVVLSSPKVIAPVAARYGWADCPVCTLYNAAGLPAEPFRTDEWPVGTKSAIQS